LRVVDFDKVLNKLIDISLFTVALICIQVLMNDLFQRLVQLLCLFVFREMLLVVLYQLLNLFLQLFLRYLVARVILHVHLRVLLGLAGLIVVHELVHVVGCAGLAASRTAEVADRDVRVVASVAFI